MARLTRVNQRVFASSASNNGVFGSAQAGNATISNDVATLQSLPAFLAGWDSAAYSGEKLPPLEEFQGIQYGISYQQAYMLQEGIAEWNADTTYYKGSFCKTISGSSFKLYCSLLDDNLNKVTTNTTYWKKVMDSDDLYTLQSTTTALQNSLNTKVPNSIGSGTKPVYTNSSGVITASNSSVGSASQPIYMLNGTITALTGTIANNISGNAATVTNGVYTTGDQTIAGTKTFSSTIVGTTNGNLDTNASNPTSTGKTTIVGWAMPKYSSIVDISSGYTAPSNGYVRIRHIIYMTTGVQVNSKTVYLWTWGGGDHGYERVDSGWIPVAKGSTIQYTASETSLIYAFQFAPATGG